MNDLQIFNNEEFGEVRTAVINDEPMFCLADICKALELTQPSKVKERLNEKGVRSIPTLTKGGEQKLLYINESNLYKTIFQSRKESAERFTEWVTSEVLPSIRKTGSYGMPKTTGGQIQLLAQGYTELEQKVNDIKDDVSELKENVPLYSCDIDEIQQHVKRRVVNILGGKQSEAYRDNSIRHKTFSDIWTQLKREYGCVSTYKSIKRKYIDDVHEFIDCYVVPKYLDELIQDANAQQSFA
jgi:prophage antirepressor-like protein